MLCACSSLPMRKSPLKPFSAIFQNSSDKNKKKIEIDIEDDILITDKPIFVEFQVLGAIDEMGYFIEKKIKNY